MNKSELIAEVAARTDMTKKEAEMAVMAALDIIRDSVAKNDPVQIVGFGTFERRDRAARIGRNPRTGEETKIPATKVPAFKAGKAFKEACNK